MAKILIYFSILLTINLQTAFGQNLKIRGTLVDRNSNLPLEFINVLLIESKDSGSQQGVLSDKNGLFEFEKVAPGKYLLELKYFNQKEDVKSILLTNRNIDLGLIHFSLSNSQIKEISVSASKSPISYKVDRKVINAESFPNATYALQLLENLPSIQVDLTGKLKYRGDGTFIVYINGHQINDGEDKLRTLPADRIDKIELITNPSAGYSSEGTAGIINVILKKNRLKGFAINSTLNLTSRESFDFSSSVDWKGERWGWYIETQKFVINTSNWISESRRNAVEGVLYLSSIQQDQIAKDSKSHLNIGFNYKVDEKNSFDLAVNLNPFICDLAKIITGKTIDQTISVAGQKNGTSYDYNSINEMSFRYFGSTLNYEHSFSKSLNHKLTFFLNYSRYLNNLTGQQIDEKSYSTSTIRQGFKNTEKNDQLIEISFNYFLPLSDSKRLETGFRFDSEIMPFATSISGLLDENNAIKSFPNQPLHQSFDFNQNVFSGFLTWNDNWKKFEYKIGLRSETTLRNFNYVSTTNITIEQITKSNFTDIFPTAHLSHNFSENSQLYASYSSRIGRPAYWKLVSLQQYATPYSYYQGNEKLRPAYSSSYEFGFKRSHGQDLLSAELFYKHTRKVIQDYSTIDSSNILKTTPNNVGDSHSIGTSLMTNLKIKPWFAFNFSSSLYYYRLFVNLDQQKGTKSNFRNDYRLSNTFTICKTFNLTWDLNYYSPIITTQSRREGIFYSDIGIKKSFFNKSCFLSFAYLNLFNSINYSLKQEGINYAIDTRTGSNPYISFKLTYSFNNQK